MWLTRPEAICPLSSVVCVCVCVVKTSTGCIKCICLYISFCVIGLIYSICSHILYRSLLSSNYKVWLRCTDPPICWIPSWNQKGAFAITKMNSWCAVCGCTVTEKKHGLFAEGKWINEGSAILSSSANLVPLVCHLFSPPLLCWALDHLSFPSLLHSTQFCHPAKETNQRALSVSLHAFPLFHSAFLCLCPLIVGLQPPARLPSHDVIHQEQWLLGSDLRSNELRPASNSGCRKPFIFAIEKSGSLV